MRVGLISDIHGNLPALEAVLAQAEKQALDVIWNMGDVVGYGPFPDQVVRLVRQRNVVSIRGNFDSKVLKIPQKKAKWREKKKPDVFLARYWAYENLSPPSREYLKSQPKEIQMRLGTTRLLLTHASPASRKEKLTISTPAKRLRSLLADAGVQVVCCGHSHQPLFRKVTEGCFINPGSVGIQNDGDPRASYAVLQLDPGMMHEDPPGDYELDVRHYRVEYDVERTVSEIRKRRLPEAFAQMLIQGKDLASVSRAPENWQVPEVEEGNWWEAAFGGRSRQEVEEEKIKEVIALAEEGSSSPDHVRQTTFLALRLFDELQPLHRLGAEERFWLRCGALLHDIGKGKKKHHLKALKAILKSQTLPFSPREKQIIGSIARYHRQETPRDKHEHLVKLPVVDQHAVTILSSILRVADGLDTSPRGNVEDLVCSYSAEEITIMCLVKSQANRNKRRALGKGKLLEFAFERDLYIEWRRI